MGWDTSIYTDISFNRKTYKHKSEVEEDIEELKDSIEQVKKDLLKLVYITEPRKFMSKEDLEMADVDRWLEEKFNDDWEMLQNDIVELWKLEILLGEWDNCHDKAGNPIRRHISVEYEDGDEQRLNWAGTKTIDAAKKYLSSLNNYMPFPIINGDFIWDK